MKNSRRGFLKTVAGVAAALGAKSIFGGTTTNEPPVVEAKGHQKNTYTEAKEIPIIRTADVVVAGGSQTGVAAAVAAARNGAKVLLVERNVYLAGQAVGGATFHDKYMFNAEGKQIVAGLMQEMAERYGRLRFGLEPKAAFDRWIADGGAMPGVYVKAVLSEMVEQAGVEVFYGTIAIGARVDNNAVTGVIIDGRGGRALVACRCAVDATGDGDLAARAGAAFRIAPTGNLWRMMMHGYTHRVDLRAFLDRVGKEVDAKTLKGVIAGDQKTLDRAEAERLVGQGTPVLFYWGKLLRNAVAGGAPNPYTPGTQERKRFDAGQFNPYFNLQSLDGFVPGPSSAVEGRSPVDTEDFSRSVALMQKGIRSQLEWQRKHLPGFENAEILFSSPNVAITESRRIVGEYVLMEEDVLKSRHFDDCIGKSGGHDRHKEIAKGEHGIPYRCLVPEKLDGLLVAGRCISADREKGWKGFDAIRGMMSCVVTGQAAGTAAALSVTAGVPPRKLDVKKLQAALHAQNVIL